MAVTFKPLKGDDFAAEAGGVDISHPLDATDIAVIEKGMDKYAVLVFRNAKPLEREAHMRFTQYFGELEEAYQVPQAGGAGTRRLAEGLGDISNLTQDGKLMARDDRRRLYNLGNLLWHSDSSFKAVPAKYSMLAAHVVPPEGAGGATQIADMRAAWDTLDPATQKLVRDMVTEHSLLHSRAVLGFGDFTPEERERYRPVQQRLVRRHPGSHRLSLFLSAHIGQILGWPQPEALALIRELTEHATQRERVYAHEWRVGDLLVWDNRTTMHRATRFDDQTYPRDMRRTTLTDVASTLEQAA
ncbi:TauD/TfdA family dioxygenase [Roseococcus sp. SYP-B2431]|uniref:TauD/TfdA dioxygenase family protein n=1 Tax=Roseococcus sp. SYP-B2431 TaxID=2496640 RepID=UPI00103B30EF|nr:TauD/TfdA family dioxygenase [Roseococcus sp. SYP-B2431]TCH98334.1 TauD/TfdA family dioxygenase [Roseococcus sp. SYP-B2431]